MIRLRRFFTFVASLGCLLPIAGRPAAACTTAVVSGQVTADGRPLLWKNRDAPNRQNEVVFLDDGPFKVVAVANAGQTKSVWMGTNDAGLCIENSVSKDLAAEGAKGLGNGSFMLRALKTCATVGDVELLLRETDATGRATNGNFGVIDAAGGAALFEASATSHVMYDANDPAVAPKGYIVRSNFSVTGQKLDSPLPTEGLDGLYSGERFARGCRLMDRGLADGSLDLKEVLRNCARDLATPAGEPLPGTVNGPAGNPPETIATASTINRKTTVSAAVFQGVRPGEDPAATTMWVLLGSPSFSVAVPCWVAAGRVAPELDGPEVSDLCATSLSLRDAQYVEGSDEVRTARLPEIWSETWAAEDAVVDETARRVEAWRRSAAVPAEVAAFHEEMSREALATLRALASDPVAAR